LSVPSQTNRFDDIDANNGSLKFTIFFLNTLPTVSHLAHSFLGPNIFLNNLFSNIFHLCLFLGSDEGKVSTREAILGLERLLFTFCHVETVVNNS
jgi:hypothetical protein